MLIGSGDQGSSSADSHSMETEFQSRQQKLQLTSHRNYITKLHEASIETTGLEQVFRDDNQQLHLHWVTATPYSTRSEVIIDGSIYMTFNNVM